MREYIVDNGIFDELGSVEKLDERGVLCGAKFGEKGCISYAECLQCDAAHRCIGREIILARKINGENDYYKTVPGVFHVTTAVYCLRKFGLTRYLGVYMQPTSIWNMMFGTVFHKEFEEKSIFADGTEVKFTDIPFEGGQGIVRVRGSADLYYDKFPVGEESIYRGLVQEMAMRYQLNSHDFYKDGVLDGVLEERKFTGGLRYILEKPSEHHLTQVRYYLTLMAIQDPDKAANFAMFSYVGRFKGEEFRHLIPVQLDDRNRYDFSGGTNIWRIDTKETSDMLAERLAILQRCVVEPYIPSNDTRMHSSECNWCEFRAICLKGNNGGEITNRSDILEFVRSAARVRDTK